MIIDFRVRPPYKSFKKMGNLFGPGNGIDAYPVKTPEVWPVPSIANLDMDAFFKEMDEAGVTTCCLLGRSSAGTSWTGVDSEDIYELCQQYPQKFVGFGSVDASGDILKMLDDVDEAKEKYNFKGIVCEPGNGVPGLYADDRKMYPFYARCAQLGLIVVISLSPLLGPNIQYSDPAHVQNVCKDFPTGKFVIAHAAYPYVLQAISCCLATTNLWLIPDSYWIIPQVPGSNLWTQGAMLLQGKKFLFGSAYPFRGLPQAVDQMKKLGLPEEYYNRVMYENAKDLLGL